MRGRTMHRRSNELRKAEEVTMQAEHNKMIIRKLHEQVAAGAIDNDWEETFISNISVNIASGRKLTNNQQAKLDELFERY